MAPRITRSASTGVAETAAEHRQSAMVCSTGGLAFGGIGRTVGYAGPVSLSRGRFSSWGRQAACSTSIGGELHRITTPRHGPVPLWGGWKESERHAAV